VIRPESDGEAYDFPRNRSSLLLVKGSGRIQSSASIPLRRAGILRRKRSQHHGGAYAAALRRASRILRWKTGCVDGSSCLSYVLMKRFGCFVLLLCSVLWIANRLHAQENAQQAPAAVISDPPPDPAYPATMAWPDIPSHGAKMYSVLYVASGAGPHPTVLMLHGFPGNEKNLDLAYSIRRAGWNVLVPFDRGAWGSGGAFSFTHTLEDAQASIDFLLQAENVKKFRIDPTYIVLIGHSMGGFVAGYATAHEPKVFGAALISAGNLGPASARQRANDPEFWERWNDNASRLVGTTAQQLVQEVDSDPAKWNYFNCVPLLKDRPIFVLEADDRNTSDNQALAEALRKAGNMKVTEQHMHTDHPFSDHRIAMQAAIVNWLAAITKARP
jgi:pimeloyl-ACP methyl ester carboxylesterase